MENLLDQLKTHEAVFSLKNDLLEQFKTHEAVCSLKMTEEQRYLYKTYVYNSLTCKVNLKT